MEKYDSLYPHLRRLWDKGKELLDGTPEEKHQETTRWIRSCGKALERAKEHVELVYPDRYPFREELYTEFISEYGGTPPFFWLPGPEPDEYLYYRFRIDELRELQQRIGKAAGILIKTGEVSQKIIDAAKQRPISTRPWTDVVIVWSDSEVLSATDGDKPHDLDPRKLKWVPKKRTPASSWEVLREVLQAVSANPDGRLTRSDFGRGNNDARKKQLNRLGRNLQGEFGRSERPFKYSETMHSWAALFRVRPE